MLAHHLLAENKQIKNFTAIFLKSKKKRFKNLRKIELSYNLLIKPIT